MHVSETVRCAKVGKETEELEHGLRELSRPGPESVPVACVGSGIGLLSVDEPRELERVTDEEDGSVWKTLAIDFGMIYVRLTVEYPATRVSQSFEQSSSSIFSKMNSPIKDSLLCPHLDRESSRISCGICRTASTTDSTESHCDRCLSARLEDVRNGELRSVVAGHFEVTMCAGAASVNHSFGNTFAIERGKSVQHMEVLKEKRARGTSSLGTQWLKPWSTILLCVGQFRRITGGVDLLESLALCEIGAIWLGMVVAGLEFRKGDGCQRAKCQR